MFILTVTMGNTEFKVLFPLLLLTVMCRSVASSLLLPNSTVSTPLAPTKANFSHVELRCFPTHAPFALHEVKMADCQQLVRDIANLDRSGRKRVFGTADTPLVEYIVPLKFSRRSCIVHIIDLESTQAAGDSFSVRYLSQKIARVADWCVRPPPHLGGGEYLS